jgi:cell division protein FtsZ
MEDINDTIDGDADIIFGTTTEDTLEIDEVKITIVATGFDHINKEDMNNGSTLLTPDLSIVKTPEDQDYYESPPLMRGYSIKYQL